MEAQFLERAHEAEGQWRLGSSLLGLLHRKLVLVLVDYQESLIRLPGVYVDLLDLLCLRVKPPENFLGELPELFLVENRHDSGQSEQNIPENLLFGLVERARRIREIVESLDLDLEKLLDLVLVALDRFSKSFYTDGFVKIFLIDRLVQKILKLL